MKKLSIIFLSLIMFVMMTGCQNNNEFMNINDIKDIKIINGNITLSFNNINGDNQDFSMPFELYYDKAPITVTNFVNLVNDNFYNNTYCRNYSNATGSEYLNVEAYVYDEDDADTEDINESNYLVQKELDYFIKGEFSDNGWNSNDTGHTFGTMSMIRSEDYDTAEGAFMICLNDDAYSNRDGYYASFGKINIDGEFFSQLIQLSATLDYYEFKVKNISINSIDLGDTLKINK